MGKKRNKSLLVKERDIKNKDSKHLLIMSSANKGGVPAELFSLLPIILFSAIAIMIVRMHVYFRPMSQFFWTYETDETQITDFFSYNKMVCICVATAFALLIILFRLMSSSLIIKRTAIYIPMIIYTFLVLVSFIGSENKIFALWGYNDRFEGTITIVCYMIMLFFVINTIGTEKDVKKIICPIVIMSIILGLLGLSQGTGHDFFRTAIGQKMFTPNYELSNGMRVWDAIDAAAAAGQPYYNFTFQNNEVYQTVYNINYVSFYLTLLIPLFGMLFIRSYDNKSNEPLWKKIGLGALFALLIYNFIASKSSGGYFGLGVIGLIGIIMLNKQLIKIWRPLVVLFLITGVVFGFTTERWVPELKKAFGDLNADKIDLINENYPYANKRPFVDYIITGESVEFSINGNPLFFDLDTSKDSGALIVKDADGKEIKLNIENDGYYSINDKRFYDYAKIGVHIDDNGVYYVVLNTDGENDWVFVKDKGLFYYLNSAGCLVSLHQVEHIGFENHLGFGSSRGYIWAASFPLIRQTIFTGHGADTYCLVFPQEDYAWKYNSGMLKEVIVDKPHNMYLHTAICTGMVSLIALVVMYGIYVFQSIKVFWKRKLENDYLIYAGFGIFCGVTAFMITGIVDDSSVSVMPLFYTMLGLGITTNIMLTNKTTVSDGAF